VTTAWNNFDGVKNEKLSQLESVKKGPWFTASNIVGH